MTIGEVETLYNGGKGISYLVADTVDLVSWWELNETNGDRIDEHGTNDLTQIGGVGFGEGAVNRVANFWNVNNMTDGTIGLPENGTEVIDGVWEFDGASEYINFDGFSKINGATEATFEIWFKRESANTDDFWLSLVVVLLIWLACIY